jgi:site-specific DNA-methyltransferase (adenine-specific)
MKFVTNLKMGILGNPDDIDKWRKILSTRRMRRACKKAKRILVIAGGHGTEVDVLVELHGKEILSKIWFNELLVCFTNDIVRRYPAIHIIKGDFLSLEFTDDRGLNMKFDVIVGNPPYQNSNEKNQGSSGKLWMKFVKKSIDLLDKGGYLAVVHPIGWRRSKNRYWNEIYQTYQILTCKLEPDINWNVGVDVDYYLLKNAPYITPTEVIYKSGDIDLVDFRKIDGLLTNKLDNHILNKIVSNDRGLNFQIVHSHDVRRDHMSKDRSAKHIYPIKHTGSQDVYWSSQKHVWQNEKKVLISRSGYLLPFFDEGMLGTTSESMAVKVSTREEADYIINLLNSSLYKFLLQIQKTSGFNDIHVLNSLPYPEDLPFDFTDEMLYDYFNLTQKEIDYIKANVK